MKKWLGIVAAIVVLGLAAGGSFYAGMQFQISQSNSLRNAFFAQRGGVPPAGGGEGFFGGGMPGAGTPGFGRGANGRIKSIDGNTLTISTPQREVKVTLSDSTKVEQMAASDRSALAVGATVLVRGEADSSGTVAAATVQIMAAPGAASP